MTGHSIRQIAMRNIRQEGWKRLYRGIFPTVTVGFPAQGVYYLGYEYSHYRYEQWIRRAFGTFDSHHDFMCHALAGCTAEITSAVLYLPADMISQRLQSQPKFNFFHKKFQYNGALDVARSIYRENGFRGFYRGLLPHLAAYIPGGAMYWGMYEASKKSLQKYMPLNDFQITLMGGACAGAASVCASNPFDVLRTRMQTYQSKATTLRLLVTRIVREEGVLGFTKGLRPRLVTAVPGSMLALSGYELIKQWSQNDENLKETTKKEKNLELKGAQRHKNE